MPDRITGHEWIKTYMLENDCLGFCPRDMNSEAIY